MIAETDIVEARGDDVEQAIKSGLNELGLGRDDVKVEVLDEGSTGFLGIGSREALVRLTVKSEPEPAPPEAEVSDEPVEDVTTAEAQPDQVAEIAQEIEEPSEKEVALEIVGNLLEALQVTATTSTRLTDPDDLTGERRWVIDISGQDMGVLIGPRGDTLNAFQFVARLMTGNVLQRRPKFIVDIEGYRGRRERALARLAERMADKVIERGRPMSLEPMPPNERRIIHLTLRQHDQVYTESSGEGRRRKVRIYPKKKSG